MSKRQNRHSHDRSSSYRDDDEAADYIYVGTEFPTEAQVKRQSRKLGPDGKPKDYIRDAFKGGFSAGYHGTAGSKEGWQPTSFTSSRSNRAEKRSLRPEDFMDEEDLADIEASKTISVNSQYRASNSSAVDEMSDEQPQSASIVGSIAQRISAELGMVLAKSSRLGDKIMAAMGWKPGQGIGAPSRSVRGARDKALRLPPKPTPMIRCEQKQGKHGAGYGVDLSALPKDSSTGDLEEPALPALGTLFKRQADKEASSKPKKKKKKVDKVKLSFGAFDDGHSDSDDATASLGAKKKSQLEILVSAPKKASLAAGIAKPTTEPAGFDGRPPLPGFSLIRGPEAEFKYYEGPEVPASFKGIHSRAESRWDVPPAESETAVASRLLTASNGRLVTANDRAQLGVMEAPGWQSAVPSVDAETAKGALQGFKPFTAHPEKQARYTQYLEAFASSDSRAIAGLGKTAESMAEMQEFARMARVFKPNSVMLSRFTSSTYASTHEAKEEPVQSPSGKNLKKDIKRTVLTWNPSRLLCKRMGVQPPASSVASVAAQQSQGAETSKNTSSRMRAADFIHWGSKNGSGSSIPMVVADDSASESQEFSAPTKRPEMSLFKSIFGDDEE